MISGIPENDDDNFGTFPIGFPFVFNGITYTDFGVNANGFITLGSIPVNSTNALSSSSPSLVNLISALNFNIQGKTGTGNLQFQSSAGVLTIQWTDYRPSPGNCRKIPADGLKGGNRWGETLSS